MSKPKGTACSGRWVGLVIPGRGCLSRYVLQWGFIRQLDTGSRLWRGYQGNAFPSWTNTTQMLNRGLPGKIEDENTMQSWNARIRVLRAGIVTEWRALSPRAKKSMMAHTGKCPIKRAQRVGDCSKNRAIDKRRCRAPCDRLQPV